MELAVQHEPLLVIVNLLHHRADAAHGIQIRQRGLGSTPDEVRLHRCPQVKHLKDALERQSLHDCPHVGLRADKAFRL